MLSCKAKPALSQPANLATWHRRPLILRQGAGSRRWLQLPDTDRATRPVSSRIRPRRSHDCVSEGKDRTGPFRRIDAGGKLNFDRISEDGSCPGRAVEARAGQHVGGTEREGRNQGNRGGAYKLLVADDQPHILEALRLLLKPEGYQLEMVRMPALVLEALAHDSFDGVLIDLNYTRDTTSGKEGMDLVRKSGSSMLSCPSSS